jgi:hypothetical protein
MGRPTKPKPTATFTNEEVPIKNKKQQICSIIKRKTKEKFLSESQKEYYEKLVNNQITICSGPAGVGKSYIAMKCAVDLLSDPNTPYEKIIIVRPAVEAEEKLGSLPGGVEEKLDPYIFPSYYLLNKIIGKDTREKLKEIEAIEVFALAYMRGMNIDNSILIFEEAQNSTPSQMKLLLTRIGFNSKFFISGDLEQFDRHKDKTQTGLWDALKKFQNMNDIGVFEFKSTDTLKKIQQEYEKWYLNNPFRDENEEDDFKYEVLSELTTLDIFSHLKFRSEDELYDFLYKEHTMEIFGHAGSVEPSGLVELNEFYLDVRESHDIIVVSDEIGKSKPASLFFISKFGCLVESVKFYSESTINSLWDSVDILLTANPKLLLNHPKNKIVIKFNTTYNNDVESEFYISSLKELKTKIQEII